VASSTLTHAPPFVTGLMLSVIELSMFCERLLRGDCRCVETLFVHDEAIIWRGDLWSSLLQLRHQFVTKSLASQFVTCRFAHDVLAAILDAARGLRRSDTRLCRVVGVLVACRRVVS